MLPVKFIKTESRKDILNKMTTCFSITKPTRNAIVDRFNELLDIVLKDVGLTMDKYGQKTLIVFF